MLQVFNSPLPSLSQMVGVSLTGIDGVDDGVDAMVSLKMVAGQWLLQKLVCRRLVCGVPIFIHCREKNRKTFTKGCGIAFLWQHSFKAKAANWMLQ